MNIDEIILNNGVKIPSIGLGTSHPLHDRKRFLSKNRLLQKGINFFIYRLYCQYLGFVFSLKLAKALKMGYRLIDTSAAYGNEKFIRWGITFSGIDRKKLFLTTRVSNAQQFENNVRGALMKSMKELGTDYIDLYMFHWPVTDLYTDTWKVLEELYLEKKVRAIGVANCHQHHLEKLFENATVIPAVNQFEIHPLMSQKPLVEYCSQKGIAVEAYTPLGRNNPLLKRNPVLKELAKKYNKTIQQIILKWHIQNGIIPVPRSTNLQRLKENISIFDFNLTTEELKDIDNLNVNIRLRFDPDNCNFHAL